MKLTAKQNAELKNYERHTFEANGYLWLQYTDHCGNVMHTVKLKRIG